MKDLNIEEGDNLGIELPLEKELSIVNFNNLVDRADKEQAIEIAKKVYRLYISQQYMSGQLLKSF